MKKALAFQQTRLLRPRPSLQGTGQCHRYGGKEALASQLARGEFAVWGGGAELYRIASLVLNNEDVGLP